MYNFRRVCMKDEGFNKKEDQPVKILLELQGSSKTPDTFSVLSESISAELYRRK